MRVGLVMEHFRPSVDRCGKWAYQLARELLSRGHEVHVVAQSFGEESQRLSIVTHALGTVRSPLMLASAAGQKLHSLTLDLIHDIGVGWYCDVFQPYGGSGPAEIERALLLAPTWSRSLRRVLWPVWPGHHSLERLWARQYINDGRLFVVPSRRAAEDLGRWHDVPRELIRRVYNGVDSVRYSPFLRDSYREPLRRRLGISDETLLVLHMAGNPRMDGLSTLLKSMAWLATRKMPVHLLVGGVRRWLAPARLAAAMRLSSCVTFVGPLDDFAPLYAAADIYAQPTASDPNGATALEALASGLPVITTQFNGISELLLDGREGYVLDDPADVAALAGRIETLCDPTVRATMARSARQLALRHTLTQNIQELLIVYEEAVRNQTVDAPGPAGRRGRREMVQASESASSLTARQQRLIHEHPATPSAVNPPALPPRRVRAGGRSGNRPRRSN